MQKCDICEKKTILYGIARSLHLCTGCYLGVQRGEMDFKHGAVFSRSELKYDFFSNGGRLHAYVKMKSGRTAEYQVRVEVTNPVFEDTGQRDYYFTLIRYLK